MFCTNCGEKQDENAQICARCGKPLHGPVQAPGTAPIPTYLAQAILCTIFCCLPFGIVGIVYAAQVSTKIAQGDILGAQAASKSARTWCWVSFGLGVAVFAVAALLGFLGGLGNLPVR
jgi:Interferon-induced transmembrane protein/zinc-ribbon domain